MLWLLPLSVVALLVVALVVATDPAQPTRIKQFARRHRLELTPTNRKIIAGYLTRTRRWRTFGFVAGHLCALPWMLEQQQIGIATLPALAGWLAGAVVAELIGHPGPQIGATPPADEARAVGTGTVARWLTLAPAVAAAAAMAATSLAVAAYPGENLETLTAWGLAALGCAAAVALASRFAARRQAAAEPGDGADADLATRRHSIAAITSVGVTFIVFCIAQQATAAQAGLFGQTAAAAGGVAWLLMLGGISIGVMIWGAAWPAVPQTPPVIKMRTPRRLAAACATLAVTALSWLGLGIWRDVAPYQPADVDAKVTIRLTDRASFDDNARALGITDLDPLLGEPGDTVFIGRLDLAVPPAARGAGYYHVVVIDRGTNKLAPLLFADNGGGWSGFLSTAARQYPWLSAMADVRVGNSWQSPGAEVSVASGTPGPIVFVGMFPRRSLTSPAELTVALILSGPQQQIYWAVPVPLVA